MSSALDGIRQKIWDATPEETPDGLVCVIYNGNRGIRLVVDRESGKAIASDKENSKTVINQDPAIAAMRAMSYLVTGGVA